MDEEMEERRRQGLKEGRSRMCRRQGGRDGGGKEQDV